MSERHHQSNSIEEICPCVFSLKFFCFFAKQIVTCADDVRHRIWRANPAAEFDEDENRRIRGRALPLGPLTAIPKACEEAINRLRKPLSAVTPLKQSCKTPKSFIANSDIRQQKKTPDPVSSSPITSRSALSPLKTNSFELTPDHRGNTNVRDRAGASRRLELDQTTDYFSPTRNLVNASSMCCGRGS